MEVQIREIKGTQDPKESIIIKYTINGGKYHATIHKEEGGDGSCHIRADSGARNAKKIQKGYWRGIFERYDHGREDWGQEIDIGYETICENQHNFTSDYNISSVAKGRSKKYRKKKCKKKKSEKKMKINKLHHLSIQMLSVN